MHKTLLMLSMSAVIFACTPKKEENKSQSALVVTSPLRVDTTYVREYVADIHSKQNVEIRSKVKGYLEAIYMDEGQFVKAGQVMFRLSNREFKQDLIKTQASLKSAEAAAKAAKLDYENVKRLHAKNIVSMAELEKAQILLESTNARVEEALSHEKSAEINLSHTLIKAPFGGVIHRIPFKIGSLIDDGTLLTTISNNEQVYAYFNVSEKEYLSMAIANKNKPSKKIKLLLANNEVHEYLGQIETQEGEFDKSTGNIAFRAIFPNPELLLKHGSTGKVQIETDLKNALIVPQKSTFEIQDQVYVFVVDKQQVVRAKNIKIKQRLPHLFVVESGLTEGDRIIFEGIQNVKDGDTVMSKFVSMKQLNFND